MTKDLRFAIILAAVVFAFVEVLALTGVGRSVLRDAWLISQRPDILVIIGGAILGGLFILHMIVGPSRTEVIWVMVGGAALSVCLYLAVPLSGAPGKRAMEWFSVFGSGLGTASLGCLLWRVRVAADEERARASQMLLSTLFLALISLCIGPALMVGATIQPKTFDFVTYRVDGSLGFNPSVVVALWATAVPWLETLLSVAYAGVALVFPILYGLQLRSRIAPPVSYLKVWSVGLLLGYLTYFLYPIAGPFYAFGQQMFPLNMPAATAVPHEAAVISFAPRNGMPSMHFGWALLFWINSCLLPDPRVRRVMRAIAGVFVGLTGLATLGLGEHYLVDLVVAAPFVIAIQALCTTDLPWSDRSRRDAVMWGFGIAYAWILGLRFGAPLFFGVPGVTAVATVLTLVAAFVLHMRLQHASLALLTDARLPLLHPNAGSVHAEGNTGAKRELRYAAAMFILSGFAGLMYEVLFSKALALTFGSTATATYAVLATYMGGMAVGAWLGGKFAAGHKQPLVFYALCEFGIAVYCALTPLIFKGIQGIYVGVATGMPPDAQILIVFRLALGITCLLVPTILMGMTLPILARFFESRSVSLGSSVAVLYGANVVGAALGAIMAGYAVLPALGVHRTTLAAAAINLLVALIAIEMHKRFVLGTSDAADKKMLEPAQPARAAAVAPSEPRELEWLGHFALIVLGIGGVVTLAIEVKYMHLLAVVAGNSTYAFSLMLGTFLIGLGLGAESARRLLQRPWPLRLMLGWLELGLGVVILAGVFMWNRMPEYFASFQVYPSVQGFGPREVVRGIVCWLAMFPPAVFIGAIYPIAMECVARARPVRQIQALGFAAALNTLGNIAGVLVGAFVLLPFVGALRSVQLLAVVCVVLGAVALWRVRTFNAAVRWAPAAAALALLALQPASFDYTRLADGANVYFQRQEWGKVIDHAESVDGGLTAVAVRTLPDNSELKTLLTNGKFQGNNSTGGEMQAQLGFALAPLLHTPARDRALTIGYGTGMSARVLHEAGFKQLDVVDLSADIIKLANRHFADLNGLVTEAPGVNTFVTDGRNFLMLQDRKYDVIGMEITSIWFAGAASLYNREFYQLVKNRLQPDGVLQQWVQLHHIGNEDVLRIIGSVRSEFRYVWLYLIGGQGIIVATNSVNAFPSQKNAALLKSTPSLSTLLDVLHDDPAKLVQSPLLDPARTDRFLTAFGVPASFWVSTDDNLFLEYSTPKGNASETVASFNSNTQFIAQHSTGNRDPLRGPEQMAENR
jgi:predicted membrane-bound spermidine synthase